MNITPIPPRWGTHGHRRPGRWVRAAVRFTLAAVLLFGAVR